MSKPKPPKPANDHLAAYGGGDGRDLTDEELDARIAAANAAQRRALKLAILRMSETSAAEINAALERDEQI